jgi:hypothetical protein
MHPLYPTPLIWASITNFHIQHKIVIASLASSIKTKKIEQSKVRDYSNVTTLPNHYDQPIASNNF